MPVKIYIGQDSQGNAQPPNYTHETRPLIDLVKSVYVAYHHLPEFYALIANLDKRNAPADLVILTPRGLGVVELKHYGGLISQRGGVWYAGEKEIKAGSVNTAAQNPHEQVRAYANSLRQELIQSQVIRDTYKIGTAVCLTNPDALFSDFRQAYRPKPERWENFTLLQPKEFAEWVYALSFESPNRNVLKPSRLEQIIQQNFKATVWQAVATSLSQAQSYGYIYLAQSDQQFALQHDEVTIGLSSKNQIPIPQTFELVSREHAIFKRGVNGQITLTDKSRNGTFINGQRLMQPTVLSYGMTITLGGAVPSDKVCVLELLAESRSKSLSTKIELSS